MSTSYTGTPGPDQLFGAVTPATFDGKGAPAGSEDYEFGGGGADTFIYQPGYGQLEVSEVESFGTSQAATLQLGSGISPAQVKVSAGPNGSLLLTDSVSGDQVQIDGMLEVDLNGIAENGVATVTFADGTVWTRDSIVARHWRR